MEVPDSSRKSDHNRFQRCKENRGNSGKAVLRRKYYFTGTY